METKPHIRPKVRSGTGKPSAKQDDDIDAMVEATRQRMESWFKDSPSKSGADNDKKPPPPRESKTSSPSKPTTASPKSILPKSILRDSKYSKKAIQDESAPAAAEEEATKGATDERVAVKDMVVEKDPVPDVLPSKSPDPSMIEGHSTKTHSNTTDPLVLSSLSELMEKAGTLPDQNSEPKVVEADLSFACMTEEEYEETVEYAESLDANEDEPGMETDTNHVFQGRHDIFDDNDSDYSENEGYSDDEAVMDPLSDEPYESQDEESMSEPEPRAFLKIWNALKEWVTPEACALLQQWRKNETEQAPSDWVPQVDRSDVGASRCAGLMAIVKMHLDVNLLHELGFSPDDLQKTRTRLADFLRAMDYSQPMVKFDSRIMWKLLTCVLVDTVMMDTTGSAVTLPSTASTVGMTEDEYRYLTQSAFTNLAASS